MDATFSSESFEKKYNSDLANDFGNLVSRVSTLIKNNFDEKIQADYLNQSFYQFSQNSFKKQLDNEIDKAINDIMTFIRDIFMEQNEQIGKSDKVQAGNILCIQNLKVSYIILSPVTLKTRDILDILGTSDVELVWGKLKAESKISISKPVFENQLMLLIDTHAHLYYDNM